MQITKKELKLLIANDKIEEAFDKLFDILDQYIEKNKDHEISNIYDVLVNNSAKFKGLIHDQNLGTIDSEEAKVTKAEVNKGIMYVINELPEAVFQSKKETRNEQSSETPINKTQETILADKTQPKIQQLTTSPKNLPDAQKINNKKWIYIAGGAVLLLILIIWQPWYVGEDEIIDESDSTDEQVIQEIVYGSFTDTHDGKEYKTIKIGNQEWMAENLAFEAPKGCWAYDKDTNNVPQYGYLYNWNTAVNVCPEGWHLPTKDEWEELINYLGGAETAYIALLPGGRSGFSAPFAGWRYPDGSFRYLNYEVGYWSSNPDKGKDFWYINFDSEKEVYVDFADRSYGMSVRCVKD